MSQLRIPVSADDHVRGSDAARVELLEYGDYQCPYCGAAHPMILRIQAKLGDELRFVFRNFPIAELHPQALPAATTAEFAASQDKFWEVHHALFEHQHQLGRAYYEQLVTERGLSPDALRQALADDAFADKIGTDFEGGVRSGVNGTPTFFINGHRYDGPLEYEFLLRAVQGAMR